jgi:hypothetical protein
MERRVHRPPPDVNISLAHIGLPQLKKLINDVVDELSRLGLDPTVLNQLLHAEGNSFGSTTQTPNISAQSSIEIVDGLDGTSSSTDCERNAFGLQLHPHAVYEVSRAPRIYIPSSCDSI